MIPKGEISILVSNDDGIHAPGIQALGRALKKLGRVTMVAPEREQSTMGHALTLHKPVRLQKVASEPGLEQWATSGTPADCVYLGIRHVLKKKPHIIISGINNGVNVGNDIYYSGTVAAAREGAALNIPAIAASLDYSHEIGEPRVPPNFGDAAQYIVNLARQVLQRGLPPHCILNVNFPNVPFSQVLGTSVSRQGFRIYTDKVKAKYDNRGRPYFWLGGKYAGFRPIEGSDCEVLDKNYISITPCRIDLTQYEFMSDLSQWDLSPRRRKSGVKKASAKKKPTAAKKK
jgi:5'-nucleotidase